MKIKKKKNTHENVKNEDVCPDRKSTMICLLVSVASVLRYIMQISSQAIRKL